MSLFNLFSTSKKQASSNYKDIQERIATQNDLYTMSQHGIQLENDGDIDSAIDVYRILIDNKWDGKDVYNRLTDIYLSRGQKEDAINTLQSYVDMCKAKNVKDTSLRLKDDIFFAKGVDRMST